MKKILLTLMLVFASVSAHAEEFYIELGRAASEGEAKAAWDALHAAHPKILGNYDVYPNQIIQPNGESKYRVQAGPMIDKREAQRVCNRLFKRQVPCFVIEGFDPKNARTFDSNEVTVPEPVVSRWDFLPWNQSGKPDAPVFQPVAPPAAKTPEPKPVEPPRPEAKQAGNTEVDVAEAIPVPVSDENAVTVGEPVPVMVAESATPPVFADNGGWLSIQPFLDEGSAGKFWKTLPRSARRGLSERLIHPLVSHDIPKVILSVGRFESEAKAMQFCRDYVTGSRYLECNFSGQPPQAAEEGENAGGGLFDRMFGTSKPEAEIHSLFWAEVLSEKTQDRALQKWEKIRTDNDELLVDVRSQITTSLSKPGVYVVRIGPLKTAQKATQLCEALKKRKVACKLVSL